MACDLDKIAAAFRIMAEVSFPDGYLSDMELAVVDAYLKATRVARAKHLLATRGHREACSLMGIGKTQLYDLANKKESDVKREVFRRTEGKRKATG